MDIKNGYFYFIKDEFFDLVKDPYLKINKENTDRPHYLAFKDETTSLYWMVPCSNKVEKYKAIVENKISQNKRSDSIMFIKLFNKETVLLFQDMFPISKELIKNIYIKNYQEVLITNAKDSIKASKTAKKISRLIKLGIKFNKTSPDIIKIENIMLEYEKDNK